MKTEKLTIEGGNLRSLPVVWRRMVKPEFTYEFGDLVVMMHESEYFRIKSNLLLAIFFAFRGDGQCEIQIASGGGSNQMSDWGAERKEIKEVVQLLAKICRERSWRISGENLEGYLKEGVVDKLGRLFFGDFWG